MATKVDRRPAPHNFFYRRGDEVAEQITLLDGDHVPIDITSNTYRAQIRRSAASATYVSITVDVTDPTGGELVLRLDPSITEGLSGEYQWDLEQNDGGVVRTLLAGRFVFDPDVTRDPT